MTGPTSRRRFGSRRAAVRTACAFEQLESRNLLAVAPFTIAVLPDIQKYTDSDAQEAVDFINSQTQWIADNRESKNIAFVSQLGDLIEYNASPAVRTVRYARADAGLDILVGDPLQYPDGLVPYSVLPGNHNFEPKDKHGSDATGGAAQYVETFGASRFLRQDGSGQPRSWFGGTSPDQLNSWQRFTAGGREFLHIALEFEVRHDDPATVDINEDVVAYAQSIIDAHPLLPVILSTHGYMAVTGDLLTVRRNPDGRTGPEIFADLVNKNPQIFMVLNGHECNSLYVPANAADPDRIVHQFLVDYQCDSQAVTPNTHDGGGGYFRTFEFSPDESTISWSTYSPKLGLFRPDGFQGPDGAVGVAPLEDNTGVISFDFDRRLSFAPVAKLATPLDNGPTDASPAVDTVVVSAAPAEFAVALDPILGSIEAESVTSAAVALRRDGVLLQAGAAYSFSYTPADRRIHLAPIGQSFWPAGDYGISLGGAGAIYNSYGVTMKPAELVAIVQSGPTVETLTPAGAVWKYYDGGVSQGTAWVATTFDDSSWSSGAAQLGYGDGDEATKVDCGPGPASECAVGNTSTNKYPATYFRHSFEVTDLAYFTSLDLRLVRDDGAVVYLNGQEVLRQNMPIGPVLYSTLASSAVGAPAESAFGATVSIPVAHLRSGTNVLAVEVHQSALNSSDMSFDLELKGTQVNLPPHAASAGGGYAIVEGDALALTAAATDPEGDVLAYAWDLNDDVDFGDATGAAPTVAWSQLVALGIDDGPSLHTVHMQALDPRGGRVTATASLAIADRPPTLTAFAPTIAVGGLTYALDLVALSDAGADAAVEFTVYWGDGTSNTYDALGRKTHLYARTAARRTITVDVLDEDGLHANVWSSEVSVLPRLTARPSL
jgi:hypothetical protein